MDELVGYSQEDLSIAFQAFDQLMKEGESFQLTLCTEQMPSHEALDTFYNQAIAIGFKVTYPQVKMVNGFTVTTFTITKGFAFALLIPILVPLFTIGLIAFGIVKAKSITDTLVPILLVAGGILIVGIALLRKPATAYIERGGKIPYLPKGRGNYLSSTLPKALARA